MLCYDRCDWQVNQIGTLTESIEAVKMSKEAGWGVMTSHRSGESSSHLFDLLWQLLGVWRLQPLPVQPLSLASSSTHLFD